MERRRSRNSSGHDQLNRKESLNRPRSGSGHPLTDEVCNMLFFIKLGPHFFIGESDWGHGPSTRGILHCFEEIEEN